MNSIGRALRYYLFEQSLDVSPSIRSATSQPPDHGLNRRSFVEIACQTILRTVGGPFARLASYPPGTMHSPTTNPRK